MNQPLAPYRVHLGRVCRKVRQRARWSQTALADWLNEADPRYEVTQPVVSRWELGGASRRNAPPAWPEVALQEHLVRGYAALADYTPARLYVVAAAEYNDDVL